MYGTYSFFTKEHPYSTFLSRFPDDLLTLGAKVDALPRFDRAIRHPARPDPHGSPPASDARGQVKFLSFFPCFFNKIKYITESFDSLIVYIYTYILYIYIPITRANAGYRVQAQRGSRNPLPFILFILRFGICKDNTRRLLSAHA